MIPKVDDRVTIIDGEHKGKNGIVVSKSDILRTYQVKLDRSNKIVTIYFIDLKLKENYNMANLTVGNLVNVTSGDFSGKQGKVVTDNGDGTFNVDISGTTQKIDSGSLTATSTETIDQKIEKVVNGMSAKKVLESDDLKNDDEDENKKTESFKIPSVVDGYSIGGLSFDIVNRTDYQNLLYKGKAVGRVSYDSNTKKGIISDMYGKTVYTGDDFGTGVRALISHLGLNEDTIIDKADEDDLDAKIAAVMTGDNPTAVVLESTNIFKVGDIVKVVMGNPNSPNNWVNATIKSLPDKYGMYGLTLSSSGKDHVAPESMIKSI